VQARHEELLEGLRRGKILSTERRTNQYGHVTYKVVMQHPVTKEK
jgi:hypothetical protein